jgi:hypothetical protein
MFMQGTAGAQVVLVQVSGVALNYFVGASLARTLIGDLSRSFYSSHLPRYG